MESPANEWPVLARFEIDEDDFKTGGKCQICKEKGLVTLIVLNFNMLKPFSELSKKDQKFLLEGSKSGNKAEPKGIEIPLDQNLVGEYCPSCVAKCLTATSITINVLHPDAHIANHVKTFHEDAKFGEEEL